MPPPFSGRAAIMALPWADVFLMLDPRKPWQERFDAFRRLATAFPMPFSRSVGSNKVEHKEVEPIGSNSDAHRSSDVTISPRAAPLSGEAASFTARRSEIANLISCNLLGFSDNTKYYGESISDRLDIGIPCKPTVNLC